TDDAMKAKFGRDLKSGKFMYGYDVEFQVESYLRYQGERFSENFDANTYLLMTKALDYFDPTRDYPLESAIDSSPESLASSLAESVKADSSEDELANTLADSADIDHISASNHQELTALKAAFAHTECQYLIVSFTTDWRFAPERSQEIVDALMATGKPVSYINVDAPHGHDSFLFDIPRYMGAVKGFLNAPFMTDNRDQNSQKT
ncbi:homoserine O-acetyltransferase, partial [Psychrobacter sp. 16-Bac2893]